MLASIDLTVRYEQTCPPPIEDLKWVLYRRIRHHPQLDRSQPIATRQVP
jgi:hypothetical protein